MSNKSKLNNCIFNQKRIERYTTKYNDELIGLINETPLNKWIEKLEKDELRNEKRHYIEFFDIILRQLLGYSSDDVKFEEYNGKEAHPVEFTLIKDNKPFAVIEVKGTTYKDLTKRNGNPQSPVEQATNYASSQGEIKWAIVTNYDEFRFFNPVARDKYISFKFRQLKDINVLKIFLLIFSKYSLIENEIPKKLLNETNLIERDLEDEFYELYSETRLMLIKEIEFTSENIDRAETIRLAQLILNRFIFLCFAEDLHLIEEETTSDILTTPLLKKNLSDKHSTMWQRLNELFIFADEGNLERNIGAFNGGLFKEDLYYLRIRDKITDLSFYDECYKKWKFEEKYEEIEEKLGVYKDTLNPIYKNLLIISTFDFGSELDVNILGHVFENSISDIEELKDDNQEQRKKDGVYYTPEYITDYICRNTIIPYLSKSGHAKTVEELISEYSLSTSELEKLDKKLKNIKIVDPACGSGAFLNKAADVLLEIHEYWHGVRYANTGGKLDQWFDSVNSRREILTNNIFGVDLNEESVEITKLSLFLKLSTTSGIEKGFKLPNLDENIRCGNSLISDKSIDDKAFNWRKEFKEIFDDGGFDIIVGNPPYIKESVNKKAFDGLHGTDYYQGKMDIWTYFGSISLDYLKTNGLVGFIAPNNWITNAGASKFRNKVCEDAEIILFRNFGNYKVFEGVGIQTMVYIMKRNNENQEYSIDYSIFNQEKVEDKYELIDFLYSNESNSRLTHFNSFYNRTENKNSYLNFIDEKESKILNNILKQDNIYFLKNNEISQGIVSPQDFLNEKNANKLDLPINSGVFVLSEDEKNSLNLDKNEFEIIKPYFTSTEIKQYITLPNNKNWIIYTKSDINDKIDQYPHIKEHLDIFSDIITSSNKPYGLHRARNEEIFKGEKIIVTRKCVTPTFSYANIDTYVAQTYNVIKTEQFDLKILLGILNSTLIKFWLKNKGKMQGNNYQLDKEPLKKIPIKYEENELTQSIKDIVDKILGYYNEYYDESYKFNKWLIRTISQDLTSISEYYNLTYDEFLVELKNQNVNVRSRDTQELIEKEFEKSVNIINPIFQELKVLEKELNKKIYELYGLNFEDIEIIENNL